LVISSLFFSNTIFRILKIFCSYKIVTIEHNTYIHKTKAEIFLDKVLSFLSIKIVAVSNSVLSFTSKQENIPKSKFKVIHNGVDFKNMDSQLKKYLNLSTLKQELGFSEKDKIVINVGRLTAQKNQENLIKAFAVFNRKNINYKLIILGEGNLNEKLSYLIKELNCENSIKLLGSKKDLIPYYLISEYFISPSVIEGFGLAHVEALYCGLPVLTTKTAGPDEFVKEGENGYFIDNTKEGILFGLEKMSKNDLGSMRLKAKESVKDFSIEKTAQQYDLLIKECLGL
jgi:glycosyltransferase involved in cell wall biosynthesis